MKTLAVCSGGLDSVSLAYQLANHCELAHIVSFDYGQRHKKELDFARQCAEDLKISYDLIDISSVGKAISNSALTGKITVPDGHYTAKNMNVTIVANRNPIMLTIAFGLAANLKLDAVAIAVHGGDHFIYPDCRREFTESFANMQKFALADYASIKLQTPYIDMSKAQIVATGEQYNVPFSQTWSCYKGGEIHCGTCGTCVERQEAFAIACVDDPTTYQNNEFWKSQTKR